MTAAVDHLLACDAQALKSFAEFRDTDEHCPLLDSELRAVLRRVWWILSNSAGAEYEEAASYVEDAIGCLENA